MEIQDVLQGYNEMLKELTCNSKVIINTLTMIAAEHIHIGDRLIKLIFHQIEAVPLEPRLPYFYLLDSILKNVGATFVPIIETAIVDVFIRTYDMIPADVRHPMRRALRKLQGTWTGLFSISSMRKMNQGMERSHRRLEITLPTSTSHPPAPPPPQPMYTQPQPPEGGLDDQIAAVETALRMAEESGTVDASRITYLQNMLRDIKQQVGSTTTVSDNEIHFDVGDLSARPDAILHSLYEGMKLQCEQCGQRFPDEEHIDVHLDWHFVVNRRKQERGGLSMSRPWFLSLQEWIDQKEVDAAVAKKQILPFDEKDAVEQKVVEDGGNEEEWCVVDESQKDCPICQEPFGVAWDDEREEWLYKGTVRVQPDGPIVHKKCTRPEDNVNVKREREIEERQVKKMKQ